MNPCACPVHAMCPFFVGVSPPCPTAGLCADRTLVVACVCACTTRRACTCVCMHPPRRAFRLTHELYKLDHDVPRSVKTLRRTVNVVFVAVLMGGMGWADTDLCRELTRGFRAAGDLRDQDSGVFRPSGDTPCRGMECTSRAALHADAGAEPARTGWLRQRFAVDSKHGARQAFRSVSFQERWGEFTAEEESLSWLKEREELLTSKAHRAVARAEEGPHEEIDPLKAVSAKTAEEMASGLVGAGMSTKQLKSTYLEPGGTFHVRVAPRFGVWQGIKMIVNAFGAEEPALDANGNHIWKLRCIDDFKVNGLNGVTWLCEHLVMPNFEFPARIAAEPFPCACQRRARQAARSRRLWEARRSCASSCSERGWHRASSQPPVGDEALPMNVCAHAPSVARGPTKEVFLASAATSRARRGGTLMWPWLPIVEISKPRWSGSVRVGCQIPLSGARVRPLLASSSSIRSRAA